MKNIYEFGIEQPCYLRTVRQIMFFLDKNEEIERNLFEITSKFLRRYSWRVYGLKIKPTFNEVIVDVDKIENDLLFDVVRHINPLWNNFPIYKDEVERIALVADKLIAEQIIQEEKNKSKKELYFTIIPYRFYFYINKLPLD
jgi:hypothetical protein